MRKLSIAALAAPSPVLPFARREWRAPAAPRTGPPTTSGARSRARSRPIFYMFVELYPRYGVGTGTAIRPDRTTGPAAVRPGSQPASRLGHTGRYPVA